MSHRRLEQFASLATAWALTAPVSAQVAKPVPHVKQTAAAKRAEVGVRADKPQIDSPALGACGEAATSISSVQGRDRASPLLGQSVVVEGVIVANFTATPLRGVFLQAADTEQDADPQTSEGVFVYMAEQALPAAAGTRLRVVGTVAERNQSTELGRISAWLQCPESSRASAEPLTFPLAQPNDLERFEGMLVRIEGPLYVTGNYDLGRYGSLDLSASGRLFQPTQLAQPGAAALALQAQNDRRRIVLDDVSFGQNPNPIPYLDAARTRRLGDRLAGLTGILDGRYGYRIQPTEPPQFIRDNPRPPLPAAVGGRLRVASVNVENYFTSLDQGQAVCGPNGDQACRGANSADELTRQRDKLLRELRGLDADVVGLLEMQNDARASVEDLVDALNRASPRLPYRYIDTGVVGSDAIKPVILYRSARVEPRGPFALLTSAVDPAFLDHKNRPVLAQTFVERRSLARFTFVLNHWKSKGSSCKDVGDPDRADGQANCNGTRTAAARALSRWLAGDPTGSRDCDFLLMGDLNAYAREDPLRALADAGFVPLIEPRLGGEAYSFQFNGQSGYLDHALVSRSLVRQVSGIVEWHIDADEPVALDYNTEYKTDDAFDPRAPYRASDHDPLLIGLSLEVDPIRHAGCGLISLSEPAQSAPP